MNNFKTGIAFSICIFLIVITWFGSYKSIFINYDSAVVGIGWKLLLTVFFIFLIWLNVRGLFR